MAVPARMSLVTLGVTDLARSSAFYEALGWRRSTASTDEISFFATADGVLALYPFRALAADALRAAGEQPSVGGAAIAINVEREDDVEQVLAEAVAAGATLAKPATKAEWGGTSGYFADPDGHLWEVAHNPYFPFDERGSVVLPS
jgi:uncharacterized protein